MSEREKWCIDRKPPKLSGLYRMSTELETGSRMSKWGTIWNKKWCLFKWFCGRLWQSKNFSFKWRRNHEKCVTFENFLFSKREKFEHILKVCRNQRNGARVADPRNCRFFINCSNQQGTGEECREGELFETSLKRCVNKGAVNCGSRPNHGQEIALPPRTDLNGPISSSVR